MINRDLVSSAIASMKAHIDRLKDDVKIVRSTPQYAKLRGKCGPILERLFALKQRLSAGFAKALQSGKSFVNKRKAVSGGAGKVAVGKAKSISRSTVRQKPMERRPASAIAKPKSASGKKLFSKVRETLSRLLPKAVVAIAIGIPAWAIWQAYQQGDVVAAAAVLLVTFGALFGYWRGIVASVISLVGIAAAYFIAPQLGAACEHLVAENFGTTGILNRGLAIGVAGLVVLLAFTLISTLVLKCLAPQSGERSFINQALGLVGGAVQAALCIVLFLTGFSVIQPILPTAAELGDSAVANRISMLTAAIDQSQLGPWVERCNFFESVPQLSRAKEIQQTFCKLDGPDQVRRLMRHPSVMELRKDPEMRKAVKGLTGDPQFVELMTGKMPPNSTVVTLLKSDAVLKLIEQPGFLKTANEVLREASEPDSSSTRTLYTSQSE